LDEEGYLFRGGEPTGWCAGDLSDTGRTAKYYVLGDLPPEQ
jgi:hypothetical protein